MFTNFKKISYNQIAQNNEHLQDLLDNEEYIEIGTVTNKVMKQLLDGKLVNLDDLSYFQIQNIGLGRSEASLDDTEDANELRNMLPFVSLQNKLNNHSSRFAVITYGVLIQKLNRHQFSSHEEFTPMILIPVEMYFDHGVSFQMIASPFINPNISIVRKANGIINYNESLNTLYSLDKFCMSYKNFAEVRFECYVTHVKLKEENYNFTDKYYHPTLNFYNVDHRYNLENERILNITNLNKNQRVALERAHDGQSFELIGSDGTGKTTTLANIACDAVHNGKRVLYLSNSIGTLKQVYSLLDSLGISSMASRLYLPFSELRERVSFNKLEKKEALDANAEIKANLEKLYEASDKYIGYLYKRINNYYIIDVLNNCIKYRDVEETIPTQVLDGIDSIYREEIPQIEQALELIDENLSKIDSIKDSAFSSIPSNIDAYADEITNLLRDISINYKKIEELKNRFVKEFGCTSVENYALLRSFLSNYNGLDKTLVPSVWLKHDKKELTEYKHAKEVLAKFKSEMKQLDDKCNYIADVYNVDVLETFNIEKFAATIYNKFKGYDNKTINKLLKDNSKLIDILKQFIDVMYRCQDNYTKMNKALKCNINFTNDLLVEKIISFMMFIQKHNYSKKWIFVNNKEGIKQRINELREILDKYDEKKKSLGIVDTKHLSDYIDSLRLKAKLKIRDKKLKDYLAEVEKLQEQSKGIEAVFEEYTDLTGEEYKYEFNPIKNFDKFCSLLEDIKDEKITKAIVRLIYENSAIDVRTLIIPFIDFGEYYIELNKNHRIICSYSLTSEKTNSSAKEKDIEDAYEYCIKVKSIQDKVMEAIKEKRYVILLEDINLLRKHLNDKKEIEKSIDSNSEYKSLLSPVYTGFKSDVRSIERLFNNFDNYCLDFTSLDAISSSFTNPFKIGKAIEECNNTCNDIITCIKNFTKYFKQDIDRFYYDKIEDVYNDIDKLLSKEDELIVYLNINRGLKLLKTNDLQELHKFVSESKDKSVKYKDAFLKAYFNNLLKLFESKINEDLYSSENYTLLERILHKEDELVGSNVEVLKSELKSRYSIANLKNMNYKDYLNKTIGEKYLFLATPKTYNLFFDSENFDCVILDDAQVLDVNEYRNALQQKQVIVAGNPLLSYGINYDLLSNMKRTAVVKLTYRYHYTPLSLITEDINIKGKIYQDVENNKGVIYSRLDINKIIEEILNDCGNDIFNIKMNIFMEKEQDISAIYDHFSSLLKRREYSNDAIINYFTNNINICSIRRNFAIDADYNIIRLDDYINTDDANAITNFLNILQICKRKLVILDDGNLLDSEIDTEFAKRIRSLIKQDISFKKNYPDDSIQKVVERLKKKSIKVHGSIGNYGLIFSKNDKLYGMLLFDLESLRESNVLNLYRNVYYGGYINTTYLFLFDLEHNFEGCIEKLIKMTEDENDSPNQ